MQSWPRLTPGNCVIDGERGRGDRGVLVADRGADPGRGDAWAPARGAEGARGELERGQGGRGRLGAESGHEQHVIRSCVHAHDVVRAVALGVDERPRYGVDADCFLTWLEGAVLIEQVESGGPTPIEGGLACTPKSGRPLCCRSRGWNHSAQEAELSLCGRREGGLVPEGPVAVVDQHLNPPPGVERVALGVADHQVWMSVRVDIERSSDRNRSRRDRTASRAAPPAAR